MKTQLRYLIPLAACALGACQSDMSLNGPTATVSFDLALPQDINTRAYSDGQTAKYLTYGIYRNNGGEMTLVDYQLRGNQFVDCKAHLDLYFVKGQDYKVIFWADAGPDDCPYKIDLASTDPTITMDYAEASEIKANNEARDAFYYMYDIEDASGSTTKSVTLARPFAQLNVGTDDLRASIITNSCSAEEIDFSLAIPAGLPTVFHLKDGTGTNNTEGTIYFKSTGVPAETFPMSGYEYVQMNYLLCGTQDAEDEEVSEITTLTNSPLVLTISNEKLGSDVVVNVTNVPLQRNYRTNIFGSLITAPYDYTVELSSSFSDDASATASKGDENYIVYTEDELTAALDKTGAYITLMDSIEYSSTITISGTTLIDLNGYTLSVGSGTSDNEDGTTSIAVSGNAYIKNGTLRLTKGITVGDTGTPLFVLDGVTVESDEADGSSSAITASGNLLFINGTTAEAGVTLSSGFLVYTTDCTVGEETSGTTTQYVDATLTWATGLTYTNSTTSSSASSVTSVVTEGFTTTTGGTTLKTITVTDGIPISAAID